jgi:hypothetical protein
MKKLIKVLALTVAVTVLLSACHTFHSCPAYSKVQKPAAEKRG